MKINNFLTNFFYVFGSYKEDGGAIRCRKYALILLMHLNLKIQPWKFGGGGNTTLNDNSEFNHQKELKRVNKNHVSMLIN